MFSRSVRGLALLVALLPAILALPGRAGAEDDIVYYQARLTAIDTTNLTADFEAGVILRVERTTGRLDYALNFRGARIHVNSFHLHIGRDGPAIISLQPNGGTQAILNPEYVALLDQGQVWIDMHLTRNFHSIAGGDVIRISPPADVQRLFPGLPVPPPPPPPPVPAPDPIVAPDPEPGTPLEPDYDVPPVGTSGRLRSLEVNARG